MVQGENYWSLNNQEWKVEGMSMDVFGGVISVQLLQKKWYIIAVIAMKENGKDFESIQKNLGFIIYTTVNYFFLIGKNNLFIKGNKDVKDMMVNYKWKSIQKAYCPEKQVRHVYIYNSR